MTLMKSIQTIETLEKTTAQIIATLQERGETIAFAESCTGGRIAAAFTAISGSSAIFSGSVVSYANHIKQQWLGVHPKTLEQHGAVSQECVHEMLSGILTMADADYAIAVSGIAGPTGGSVEKPVGTVYIGIRTPQDETIYHHVFAGNRTAVQEASVYFAIQTLGEKLDLGI